MPNLPRRSYLKWAPRESPAERLGENVIEVLDELNEFPLQIRHRGEAAATDHLPHDHAEDDLNLIEPRCVLGQEHEANAMVLVRQERLTTRHRV